MIGSAAAARSSQSSPSRPGSDTESDQRQRSPTGVAGSIQRIRRRLIVRATSRTPLGGYSTPGGCGAEGPTASGFGDWGSGFRAWSGQRTRVRPTARVLSLNPQPLRQAVRRAPTQDFSARTTACLAKANSSWPNSRRRIISTTRVMAAIQARASRRKIVAAVAAAPVVRHSAPSRQRTCQGVQPRSSRRWWMWSRSGESNRRPVSLRRTIAATMSNIGRVITTAGAVIASVAEVFSDPWIPSRPTRQSDHHAAGVAEEDAGRREVVDQEAGQRSGQHDGHHGHVVVALAGGDHAQHGGGRKADDRRQAVHAVDADSGR